jgi:hypothetical protein
MNPTIGTETTTYHWVQKNSWGHDFSLQEGNREIGSLRASSWTHQEYTAIVGDTRYVFRQQGFWRRLLICEDATSRVRVMTFTPNWGVSKGKIEYSDGRTYYWSTRGFLRQISSLADEYGNVLLEMQEGNNKETKGLRSLFRSGGSTKIYGEPKDRTMLSLLVLFSLFLLLCRNDEATSVAAVVAASG